MGSTMILGHMGRDYGDHMGWDDPGPWLMIVFGVAVLAVLIGALVVLARFLGRPSRPTSPGGPIQGSARDLLDQRYARGEIDTAEYEERRQRLS